MATTTDQAEIITALEKFTNGLYILTTRKPGSELETRDEDYLAAGTVAWATQSSFEPPMLAVAIQKDSDLAETTAKSYQFAIHILGPKQKDMAMAFSKDSEVDRTGQSINGYSYHKGLVSNLPILNETIGYLECEVVDMINHGGDHILFLGKVIGGEVHDEKAQPLHEWKSNLHYGG
jgi:flavin reductase (DIM6/NTAB) family NADH-FMN oxidoreductase RutF